MVDPVVRIVLALLSLLTTHRPAQAGQARMASGWPGAAGPHRAGGFGPAHATAVLAGPGGPEAPTVPRPARRRARRGGAERSSWLAI